MRSKLDVRNVVIAVFGLGLALGATRSHAQTALGTAFTYQGRLNDAGVPSSGSFDFEFRLFDALSAGAQIGSPVSAPAVAVATGLFTVSLDFGPSAFGPNARWLEIAVRPAGGGAYTTLSPRQRLTPTPGALFSSASPWSGVTGKPPGFADDTDNDVLGGLTCASSQLAKWNGASWACAADADSGGDITAVGAGTGLSGGGTGGAVSLAVDPTLVQSRVGSTCAAGSSIRVVNQDGTVVCHADATGSDWSLGGNAGTNPATNFIGTTDNQALELRVNNLRALRLEQVTTIAGNTYVGANVGGGSSNNSITTGVSLATIAGGGGTINVIPNPNTVTDVGGTVGGGWSNRAGNNAGTLDDSLAATVGGGNGNVASGAYSAVAGGLGNRASGYGSAVAGGQGNTASGAASVVAGGANTASGAYSGVAAGVFNTAGGNYSFAAGRQATVRDAAASGDADGDEGTFAWADSQGASFDSTGPNQFLIRAAGGVGINTNAPGYPLEVSSPSDTQIGIRSTAAGGRIWTLQSSANGYAGWFQIIDRTAVAARLLIDPAGTVTIPGTLVKGAGSFKIDHPLDPLNKYLYHSFVESPDMMNIYNGNIATGADGFATIELPEWFEALNRDFRYQLTVIGEGTWARARIARKIEGNRFVVQTDVPSTEVSWQVTGIRKDAFAEKHRIPIEQDKPEAERGRCLHPEACGGPEEKGIDYQERTPHAGPASEPPAEPEPARTRGPGARR